MNKIENLATKIFEFYKDYDPYECANSMEEGETEEDVIAKIAEQLLNQTERETILEELLNAFEEMLEEKPLCKKAYDIIKSLEEGKS